MFEGFEHWDEQLPSEAAGYLTRSGLQPDKLIALLDDIIRGRVASQRVSGVALLHYALLTTTPGCLYCFVYLAHEVPPKTRYYGLGIFNHDLSVAPLPVSLQRTLNGRISSALQRLSLSPL